ncbi:SPOR domain-containing protein [Agarilytica rhodophyticola]|uniref:SPOR domain-containing protein n=1 Tax=Agarilytica rhodophyticola TaxID=1737490 RepID=UPI000B343D8C|nr:SPOR domain-containing protein [Agarilytica rhodophyticola]
MDDGLKQRLVGAFVLLALAVIFVPVFFDRERIEPVSKITVIPPAPQIDPLSVEKAEPPKVNSTAKDAAEMYLPDENELQDSDVELSSTAETAATKPSPKPTVLAKPTSTPKPDAKKLSSTSQYLDAQGVPKGWVLQVASFIDQEKAIARRDQLIKQGYAAYTENVKTSKGARTRLYVGPKFEKNTLLRQKKEIDKKLGVNSIVLKFKP